MSMPGQIAVLLALTHGQFDTVPIDDMAEAERTVLEAAQRIPVEMVERFVTASSLSDEDRKAVVALTQEALAHFQTEDSSAAAPAVEEG